MSTSVARHLLALCGLIPLPDLTQEEVDYLFRRLVEDVPPDVPSEPPDGVSVEQEMGQAYQEFP
jgi:hypothetical protein